MHLQGGTPIYYMASSVSGQDEANRALWLATRTGKMELSCPLGTTRGIPQEKFVCSVKMAGYWPRSFFAEFLDLDFVSVHEHAKNELGQYPAILTSHLVNNPYILPARVANHWAEFDLSCPLIKNELYNLHLHPITSWCTYCWVYYTCHCPLMQMSYKAGSKYPAHVPFAYLFLNSSGEVRSVGGKHLMGFKSNTSVFKLLWLQSMNRA